MALIRKPAVRRDLLDRKLRLSKQMLRTSEASLDNIDMRRTAESEFELAHEVVDAHVRDLRKLSKA